MTIDTLETPGASGRLRNGDEQIYVWDSRDGSLLHEPPIADELSQRMELLCAFGNGEIPRFYVHPVARAILLHFWLAYDHPFVDGNGRTARALFYWSMLRQGYWLSEYLSVSSILRKAPAQYMRAYLYSESDNDTTYFVLFNMRVIQLANRGLNEYLKRKMKELRQTERLIRGMSDLNHRQIDLLSRALRHPDDHYTIEAHRAVHGVVYQTARTDLLGLSKKDLLIQKRVGGQYLFYPPDDLRERITSVDHEATVPSSSAP